MADATSCSSFFVCRSAVSSGLVISVESNGPNLTFLVPLDELHVDNLEDNRSLVLVSSIGDHLDRIEAVS